jgi:LacI family transcriptional regulator
MTVIEIAKKAGVSIGTVDRVLHHRGRVSNDTQKKIEQIIADEGFQPNPLARHLKRGHGYKIGLLIPDRSMENGYWTQQYEGMAAGAEKLSAFAFEIKTFEYMRTDRLSLKEQFERMCKSDCCAYVIAPLMQEEMLVLLSGKNALPITKPYCFIDSPLPGASPLCTVAQNPFQAGYTAAHLTRLCAGRSGDFAVIKPFSEAYNLNERVRGFCKWFKEHPYEGNAVTVICSDSSDRSISAEVYKLAGADKELAGICTVNEATHVTAEKVDLLGLKKNIAVTGFDLVAENCAGLKSDKIDGLISQNPCEQGKTVMMNLYRKLVLEEDPDENTEIPIDIYFKENLV